MTRTGPVVALSTAGLAFFLYLWTLAPGYTWANFGADGGELLAAAVSNGVPHPPGYPLYVILLQGWLFIWEGIWPASDLAWRGNLFSALCASISAGITVHLLSRLWTEATPYAVTYAVLAALAWAVSPLLWSQALITEVYALHSVIFVSLAWVVFAYRPADEWHRGLLLGVVIGFGMAHHLTTVLLLPAIFYWLWTAPAHGLRQFSFWGYLLVGMLPGLLLYLRIPLVAVAGPPINWGYADSLEGFWWLISGAAYRHYLFGLEAGQWLPRLSTWAWVLSSQYTPIGFAIAVVGLYHLDQQHPRFRNFGLFWLLPLSLYVIAYNTIDSEVYLLPGIWLLAIWLVYGMLSIEKWLQQRSPKWRYYPLVAASALLFILTGVRSYDYSLRQNSEAMSYLAELAEVLEPRSVVFSSADAETFTLWYGAYATGELLEVAPGSAFVNVALYQFEWYRRLVADLYPDLEGIGSDSVGDILAANAGKRPIYFTEPLAPAARDHLVPVQSIWRYVPESSFTR